MIILHDEETLLHETVELLRSKLIPAIESPDRIRAIVKSIQHSHQHELRITKTSLADRHAVVELAHATHQRDYLDHIENVFQQWLDADLVEAHESVIPECFRLQNVARSSLQPPKDIFARAGYYAFDMSSGISKDSWRSITASANLVVEAVRVLLSSIETASNSIPPSQPKHSILALCRPPGHHCTGEQAGGYCYINNIALAVTALRQSPTKNNQPAQSFDPFTPASLSPRFAILDLDFHHGNGTQSQFYHDPNVFYTSIHGEDEFPYYTGAADERGPQDHPAYGTNLNLPLATGSSFDAYKSQLVVALDAISDFQPDYLLVSLGFDTFHLDPLGTFGITGEDYEVMASMVRKAVGVPAVIVLEGGYVVDRLGENLLTFLRGWEHAEGKEALVVDSS